MWTRRAALVITLPWTKQNNPKPEELEAITEFAFKSRIGLLFLDECLNRGVELGPKALELHSSLMERRKATDRVVVKLAKRLDEVAKDEWVLFKSIKPFASTTFDSHSAFNSSLMPDMGPARHWG